MQLIKILGAGLAGLSAAINLSKVGKEVTIYEKRSGVGEHTQPHFQVMNHDGKNILEYLAGIGLEPKRFEYKRLSACYLLTRKRDLHLRFDPRSTAVYRGGKKSLEYGLYRQALKSGVLFEFESGMARDEADIIATGSSESFAVAFGGIFDCDFEDDHFLMMFDDRFSPRGSYFFIAPHLNGKVEVINSVTQPHGPKVKNLFFKAIKERPLVRRIIGNSEPVSYIHGKLGIGIRKSCVENGQLLVGEAAGFQDAFMGFGMHFALESGKMAADAIIHGKDYDCMWKSGLLPLIKEGFARRFVSSLLGDRLIETVFRNARNGELVDFSKPYPHYLNALIEPLYRMEVLKKYLTGYW